MSGRELRVAEDDRVIGTILGMTGASEAPRVVVELEDSGRVVGFGPDAIERRGGKYYLRTSPEQTAELPAEDRPGVAPPESLPYGGVTPGWGGDPSARPPAATGEDR